jgi:hypothetical protein
MHNDKNARPEARSDISAQAIGDEVMLYDSAGEKIHVLNHSAQAIWKLCNGRNTLDDIRREMACMYPDAGSDLIDDISSIVAEFIRKGLLV